MAWLVLNSMETLDHTITSCLAPFLSYLLMPKNHQNIYLLMPTAWTEPGPPTQQATALSIKCFLYTCSSLRAFTSFGRGHGGCSSDSTSGHGSRGPAFDSHWELGFIFFFSLGYISIRLLVEVKHYWFFNFPRNKCRLSCAAWGKYA